MKTKQEMVYELTGIVMDVLSQRGDEDLDKLDSLGREIATQCYDALLHTDRAILVDGAGNVAGSVDLIGKADIWMLSELDWKQVVYEGLRIKP